MKVAKDLVVSLAYQGCQYINAPWAKYYKNFLK